MQFLKTIFWVFVAVLLVVLWLTNEERVDLDLGVVIVTARISTYLITAFLLGFVPLYLVHRTMLWRLRRRISSLENTLRPSTSATTVATTADPALSSID